MEIKALKITYLNVMCNGKIVYNIGAI